jgi:flagellar biogenesis protein FliO
MNLWEHRTSNIEHRTSNARASRSSLRRSLFAVRCSLFSGFLLSAFAAAAAESTNPALPAGPLPDVGPSLLRVFGALALVLAIFLGGVWLYRNWQRLVIQRGRAPQLNVLEVRALGGRHALYVVGYHDERFLIAASPTGVNLVSHLQPGEGDRSGDAPAAKEAGPQPSFAEALTKMLRGK